jgi:hypothetical protein
MGPRPTASCADQGQCAFVAKPRPNKPPEKCRARVDAHCGQARVCQKYGRCPAANGMCIATSDAGCAKLSYCAVLGLLQRVGGLLRRQDSRRLRQKHDLQRRREVLPIAGVLRKEVASHSSYPTRVVKASIIHRAIDR